MDVDHIVQRRGPCRLLPYIASKHFARYNAAVVSRKVFKQIELAGGELNTVFFPNDCSPYRIDFQIANFQCALGLRLIASQQCSNAGPEFRKCECFDQVVVGTGIEPEYPVFDRVFGRQQENRQLHPLSPQRLEDFNSIATGKHDVQNNQVEYVGAGMEEPFLAGLREDNLIALRLKAFLERARDLGFVFDYQDLHHASSFLL
jgi:hypothetical protein